MKRYWMTHTGMCSSRRIVELFIRGEKKRDIFMASQVMRITLKAYDHQLVDASASKIIETVKKNGATVRNEKGGLVLFPLRRK